MPVEVLPAAIKEEPKIEQIITEPEPVPEPTSSYRILDASDSPFIKSSSVEEPEKQQSKEVLVDNYEIEESLESLSEPPQSSQLASNSDAFFRAYFKKT
jgi:hypothetical protein